MRMNRPMMSGLALGLAALLALGGCGGTGTLLEAQQQGRTLAASAQLDEPDLPLDRLPAEELHVPTAPTRHQQAPTSRNAAALHVSPAEYMPALKKLINEAEESVYVEVFNFGNDAMGRQIAPLLAAKARKGVEVKVVMDYIGSRFLKGHKAMVAEMRAAGVEVRNYRPRTVVKDDRKIGVNITHRKIYLADGKVAMVGGVNLMAPFESDVQDVLITWRGPVVGQLYNEFAYDWYAAKGTTLHQVARPEPVGHVNAQIIVTSPGEGRFEAKRAFYRAIEEAEREIMIEQQYLWDDELIHRLEAALKRGVKVRTIVPGHSDTWKNIHVGELKRLEALGAQTRLYRGQNDHTHLHAKVILVDDDWGVVGSINGDTRALIENQELGVVTTDKALLAEVRARFFEQDWAHNSVPAVYPNKWYLKPIRSLMELIDYYL